MDVGKIGGSVNTRAGLITTYTMDRQGRNERGVDMKIEVPDELARQLDEHKGKLREVILLGLQQLQLQEALLLYQRGVVSLGRAAELAGISARDMVRQARASGIEPAWSEEMARDELA